MVISGLFGVDAGESEGDGLNLLVVKVEKMAEWVGDLGRVGLVVHVGKRDFRNCLWCENLSCDVSRK